MDANNIRDLAPGTNVTLTYLNGFKTVSHPAKIVDRKGNDVGVLVYFSDQPQRKIRWSLRTNQPVGESLGRVGQVHMNLIG